MSDSIFANKLKLKDLIDIDFLQKFQDLFAEASGMASITVDEDGPITRPSNFTPFCKKYTRASHVGFLKCLESDINGGQQSAITGQPAIYTCHAGLTDFAAPIILNGAQIGTVLGGQVLTTEPEEELFKEIAREINVNETNYINALRNIRRVSEAEVKIAAHLLYSIANIFSEIWYQQVLLRNSAHSITEAIGKTITSNTQSLEKLFDTIKEILTYIVEISEKNILLTINAYEKIEPVALEKPNYQELAAHTRNLMDVSAFCLKELVHETYELSKKINQTQTTPSKESSTESIITDLTNFADRLKGFPEELKKTLLETEISV